MRHLLVFLLAPLFLVPASITSGHGPEQKESTQTEGQRKRTSNATDPEAVIRRHSEQILAIPGVERMSVGADGREILVTVAQVTSEINRSVPSKLEGWPVVVAEQTTSTVEDLPRGTGEGSVVLGGPFDVMRRHLDELAKDVGRDNLLGNQVREIRNGQFAIVLSVKQITPALLIRVPDEIEGVPVEIVPAQRAP